MALLFGDVRLYNPNIVSQILSSQLAFGLLTMSYSLKLFSFDASIREREFTGGIPVSPFYVGKIFGSACDVALLPFAYVCGNYSFINAIALFEEYLGLYLMLAMAISGLANFLSVTFTVG
jgi:hypothetical protein